MDAIVSDVLQFDRFDLDLGLSRLRVGGQTIDLRPKAFAVLKLLAENAGRLVSKDALYRTVWPDIAVGDDSLSQCIHELRQILGDRDHQLIRTVSRRGYVLNAAPAAVPPRLAPGDKFETARRGWRGIGLSLFLGCAVLLLLYQDVKQPIVALLDEWVVGTDNLMLEADVKRVAELAATKQLPLPIFRIRPPAQDVSEAERRFLGVWVSDTGWVNSDRQMMMIVTSVSKDGTATGYLVNGPAKPHSRVQGPAFSGRFTGYISNGTLRYDGHSGIHLASFMPDGRIQFRLVYLDGTVGLIILDPAWVPRQDQLSSTNG